MTLANEVLEEANERVSGGAAACAEAEIIVSTVQPCAAEVTLRGCEAAPVKVVVDIHTAIYLRPSGDIEYDVKPIFQVNASAPQSPLRSFRKTASRPAGG